LVLPYYGEEKGEVKEVMVKGNNVGDHRQGKAKQIKKKLGRCCRKTCKFKLTTSSNYALSVTENLMNYF